MYLTVKQQLKHLSKEEYQSLRYLCHVAKNLVNQAIYNVRQYYFQEAQYLNYQKNYALLKDSENYKLLNSNMAQQILKDVDGSFQSFFKLRKLAKSGKYPMHAVRLPKYLSKDGYATLIIGMIRLNNDHTLTLPMSQQYKKSHDRIVIRLPKILYDKKIKEIRIIPKQRARFFEVQYVYETACIQRNLEEQKALAVDFGVNNLMTCVTSEGQSFIIDGKRLKAENQWYNKRISYLQSIKDKQRIQTKYTRQMQKITDKRCLYVMDYIHKAAKKTIDYCIQNQIGVLVVGYNVTFQRDVHMGRKTSQKFVMIPYGKLREILEYLCQLNGIQYVQQEESYTSKASFWDQDMIPIYNDDNPRTYTFSGKRIHRGLYQSKSGTCLNADVNGALNILRKSNVVSLNALYSRGEVDTPARIRVA